MFSCRKLNPCFPHRVVRAMSKRDRRLYVLFHACLWTGVLAFAIGTGLYAALRTYAFFIMALPCMCVMFIGQFGFRWLAVRNGDKFEMFYPRGGAARGGSEAHGHSTEWYDSELTGPGARQLPEMRRCGGHLGPPPPPAYTEVYDGPIFTIDGTLAPPPEYSAESPGRPAPVPKREGEEAEVPQ